MWALPLLVLLLKVKRYCLKRSFFKMKIGTFLGLVRMLLLNLIVLGGCGKTESPPSQKSCAQNIVDLNDSTTIILAMLRAPDVEKTLASLLEDDDATPEKINFLIKNFSPAEIAFETEVLSFGEPVIVVFYSPTDEGWKTLREELNALTCTSEKKVKVVFVNTDELWKIAQQAQISTLPTISIMKNRTEILHLDDLTDRESMKKAIFEVLAEQ
jgi:thioredoxin family protein